MKHKRFGAAAQRKIVSFARRPRSPRAPQIRQHARLRYLNQRGRAARTEDAAFDAAIRELHEAPKIRRCSVVITSRAFTSATSCATVGAHRADVDRPSARSSAAPGAVAPARVGMRRGRAICGDRSCSRVRRSKRNTASAHSLARFDRDIQPRRRARASAPNCSWQSLQGNCKGLRCGSANTKRARRKELERYSFLPRRRFFCRSDRLE